MERAHGFVATGGIKFKIRENNIVMAYQLMKTAEVTGVVLNHLGFTLRGRRMYSSVYHGAYS